MTCIVGLVESDRVLLAADSLASTSDWGRERLDKKIFFNGDYLLGVCGSYRAMQILQYHAVLPDYPFKNSAYEFLPPENSAIRNSAHENSAPQNSAGGNSTFENFRAAHGQGLRIVVRHADRILGPVVPNDTPVSLEAVQGFFVQEVVPAIQTAFIEAGFEVGEDDGFGILMAVDRVLVEIEEDYQVGMYEEHMAAGSGIHYALGSLYTSGGSQTEGRDRLRKALDTSKHYVPTVGGTLYVGDTKTRTIEVL
jgi:hypothetical protein